MSAAPFFSIIVPTYNHAKYVGAALDSILAQSDPDWEAVVVNDGSTDDTPKVLDRYAARDARIRVFHKANGGTGSALNAALAHARGQWVCWLSSDDFFDPQKLATHRKWMQRDPSCRFFFTYFRLFDQAKNTTVDHHLWGPLPEREFQTLGLFYRNYISGISICIHRQTWESVGRFNEKLRYAQDYDMWLRLLARHPATFIPEWTCINRHHSGQYSEIFPQACYYDTAAAGVQFLNDHRFEQLFPLLDLRDPAAAFRAVERTLTRAADETSFLYWYGAHPNLIARTLEWAWDRNLGNDVFAQRAPARQLARQMLGDTARQLRGTPLGWHWQVAAAAAAMPDADFPYRGMSPLDVGLAFLHDLRAQGKTNLADLQRYFKMQYNQELPPAPPRTGRRTVVIEDNAKIAQHLHTAGCKVVVVDQQMPTLRYEAGIPSIGAANTEEVMRRLLPPDAVVWTQAPQNIHSFASRHHCVAHPAETSTAIADRILAGPTAPSKNRPTATGPRRKIVFIGRSPWGGGAERVTFDLLHGLDPCKYELHFVHLFRASGQSIAFDPVITVHDVEELLERKKRQQPIWRRLIGRAGRLVSRIGRKIANGSNSQTELLRAATDQCWPHVLALREIFQKIGSDALLIPVMEEAVVRVWIAQAFAPQPYVAWLHTAESHYMPMLHPSPDRLSIENFLLSQACRNAAAVAIPSHGCRDDLSRNYHVPAAAIEVMPNPVNVNAILECCGDMPEVPLPALHGKCLFVHAARLSAEKDHALLLKACSILKERKIDFLVACLGKGELGGELQRQIDAMGLAEYVLLLGEVKNPFAYMARAQGLVLTSRFEAFALVLAEALACGAVPIAVDCPYGPREVLQDGKKGLLVPMNDAQALADAMQRVATDRALRETTRVHGLDHARTYDLNRIVSQWEAVFDELAPNALQPEILDSSASRAA